MPDRHLWTSAEIVAATGGTLSGAAFEAGGITYNSREIVPGDLFLALKGARDGHDFAAAAFAAGAAGAITEHPVEGGPSVVVADTLRGLEALGMAARDRAALEPALREALAPDRLAECLGTGPLGLFELRRARIHPPLSEILAGPLTPSLALLRAAGREAAHAPHRRLALHAPPALLAALRALPEALAEYERAAGHAVTLTAGESGITDAE
jgi:hypothetical protein